MKKFIALLMKRKKLRMNGKMMSLAFSELFKMYKKIRKILFPYLLTYFKKDTSVLLIKVINI